MIAPLPCNEVERLHALHHYNVLDTGPEQAFDDITLLASQICGTKISTISLVDQNRQWFKSKVGTEMSETSRDIAFCAHGILQPEVLVVEDARADIRFAANPFVTGNKIRFYGGAPIIAPDGYTLGILCVIDLDARLLSPEQITGLQALSRQDAVESNRSADSPGHHRRKTFVITTDDWRNSATRHLGANSLCKPRRPGNPQFR
jgi:GAF domain-containing protein